MLVSIPQHDQADHLLPLFQSGSQMRLIRIEIDGKGIALNQHTKGIDSARTTGTQQQRLDKSPTKTDFFCFCFVLTSDRFTPN